MLILRKRNGCNMKRQLKILLTTGALFTLAGGLFGPLYAVFVEQIGGDLLTAGGAYSAFAISAGVLTLLFSKWEDKSKHQEKLVILGYALSCIGFLGYLLIREPIHLFAVQIIFGVANAVNNPAYDSLYSKFLEKGKFASQWGMWESMVWIVSGIAALAGGFVAKTYGFRTLFIAMFAISLVGLVTVSMLTCKKWM
jgi:MFS family permease